MELCSAAEKKPPRSRGGKKTRSSVTNGRRLFLDAEIDQRGPVARRFRDLTHQHAADLGGAAGLSEAQTQLIRRVSMIEVQLESLEGRMVAGDDSVCLEEFARISSHLRRLWEALGIRRVARDVSPSLADIVARYAEKAAVEPAATTVAAEPESRASDAALLDEEVPE